LQQRCSRARTRRRASRQRREAGRGVQRAVKTDLLIGKRMAQHRQALLSHQSRHRGAARRVADAARRRSTGRAGGARLPRLQGVARAAGAQAAASCCIALPECWSSALRRSPKSRRRTTASRCSSRRIDVAMAVETFRYYAGWADKLTGGHATRERQFLHLHAARAGGCSGRDRAWNFPLNLASWKVAPALGGRVHGRPQPAHADAAHRLRCAEIGGRGSCRGRAQRRAGPGPPCTRPRAPGPPSTRRGSAGSSRTIAPTTPTGSRSV